jgi:secreted trypsin-like serine protease
MMANLADDPRFQENKRQLEIKAHGGVRVLGGMAVPPGEFMDCVAVGCGSEWFCSGTLIAPNVVITAAHCARCASHVFFGDDVRGVPPGDSSHPSVVSVDRLVRHDDYEGRANDLMVLVLSTRVNIAPRRLATTTQIDAAKDGRVAGFGWVDERGRKQHGEKRMVDVPVASHACEGTVGGEADEQAYGCVAGLELVAKRKGRIIKDTCKGDSGGPLYIEDARGEWLLAAATSRGTADSPRMCGDGGIYTRLDRYKTWIDRSAGIRL